MDQDFLLSFFFSKALDFCANNAVLQSWVTLSIPVWTHFSSSTVKRLLEKKQTAFHTCLFTSSVKLVFEAIQINRSQLMLLIILLIIQS